MNLTHLVAAFVGGAVYTERRGERWTALGLAGLFLALSVSLARCT